jgi:DNA-binding CsgD family transcriptional regulator/predicted negative regulator of RcsB-dependent stress response
MRSEWNQAAHRGREWPSRLDMLSCHDEAVTTVPADTALARGYGALAVGNWSEARGAFEEAVRTEESPEALDGLGRSLWWLHEGRQAIVCRERAYSGFRRDGDLGRAARIALWLSREYSLVFGNNAAARGWLARAERLLRDVAPGVEQGWLDLARSEGSRESSEAAMYAESALNAALAAGDPDLELRALAQLGFARVSGGEVDEGLAQLDEAMAAATSGEPASLETFADICCTLMLACEQAGDMERPQQWSAVLEDFVRKYDHVVLLAFCRTCCADVFAANGRVDAAEEELVAAIKELTDAGQRSRCVNPAARLAEIRVLQGRFDEAEELLVGFDGEPDATRAAVGLRLARGEPAPAAVILERRLDEVGRSSVLAVPLLDQLVDARLAEGRLEDASVAADAIAATAGPSGRERIPATAAFARGRVAMARGDAAAVSELQKAINHFTVLGLRLDAARCRLALARTLASESPEIAIDTARQARNELEALGDSREADIAAALMRSLGAKGRAGPRATGLLTQREIEVLRLLGEGLTNAEIAARLFISPKTAEHHVSRIFAKLGLSKRSEAAAYAVRHLEAE